MSRPDIVCTEHNVPVQWVMPFRTIVNCPVGDHWLPAYGTSKTTKIESHSLKGKRT